LAGEAAAGGTANLDVSATVLSTCGFNTGGTVAFTLDPAIGGAVAGAVSQPTFWCTNGTTYTITDDDGINESGSNANRMRLGTTANYVPYSMTYTAGGSGLGKSNSMTMNIAASVAGADYINSLFGSYTDTVVLTVTP
jgi:spore coat protein U-like protein